MQSKSTTTLTMEHMCRTCMSDNTLRPLFPYEAQFQSFERALFLCTGLKIKHLDGLPQYICRICSKLVESAIRFRNQSRRVEKTFHNFLNAKNKSGEDLLHSDDRPDEDLKVLSLNKDIKGELEVTGKESPECESGMDNYEVEYNATASIAHDQVSVMDNNLIHQVDSNSKKKNNDSTNHTKSYHTNDQRYLEYIEGPFDPNMPIKCKICKKYLSTLEIFKGHTKSHIGHDLVCEFCGKKERSNITLLRHQRAKHGLARDNSFPCTFCNYKALDKEQIEAHERHIHTKERPFVCDECGEAFYSKRVLVQHGVIHKPDKPFQCDFCSLNFKSRSRLTGHIVKVHKKIRKYTYGCLRCAKRYSVPADARHHMAKIHGMPKEQQGKVPRFTSQPQDN